MSIPQHPYSLPVTTHQRGGVAVRSLKWPSDRTVGAEPLVVFTQGTVGWSWHQPLRTGGERRHT